MKTSTLIALLTVLNFALCHNMLQKNSLVSNAINGILSEHFTNYSWRVQMVLYGNKSARSVKISEKILHAKSDSTTFMISTALRNATERKFWEENESINALADPTILLFDSVETFKFVCPITGWQLTQGRYNRNPHIVYVPNITNQDIAENVPHGFDIDLVGFLMNETEKSIDLVTSFMYTENACRTNQLVTINRFSKSAGWANKNFYPDKYRNLHNCSLKVFTFYEWNESTKPDDPVKLIIEEFVRKSNGTVQTKFEDGFELADVFLEISDKFLFSFPVEYTTLVFFMPPGDPYTQLEKMFLPFQKEFWFAIAVMLLMGLAAVQVINLTSQEIQNFVYGRFIQTQSLNLISIFLNGAQYKIPGRNFARFLLMMFVLWSFVIRTCYQSELFKYLQADMRKPLPETIDELFSKNFSIYDSSMVRNNMHDILKKYPIKIIPADDLILKEGSMKFAVEPENKAVVLAEESNHVVIHNLYRSGFSSLKILQETFRSSFRGMAFDFRTPFYKIMNEQIMRMFQAGIIQYNEHRLKKKLNDNKNVEEDIGAQVLTLDHLGIGFIFCLIPLGVGSVLFAVEVLILQTKIFRLKLMLLCAVNAHLRDRIEIF